jgi:hypothetical protein
MNDFLPVYDPKILTKTKVIKKVESNPIDPNSTAPMRRIKELNQNSLSSYANRKMSMPIIQPSFRNTTLNWSKKVKIPK